VPWFSGLCLEGEVAGQYEIERSGSQQELEEAAKPGLLELDGLAPITIFVGANNSGKSRLMRELFGNSEAARCLQLGPSDEFKSDLKELSELCSSLERLKPYEVNDKSGLSEIITSAEAFLVNYRDQVGGEVDCWTGISVVSVLDAINARIDSYLCGRHKKASPISFEGWFDSDLAEEERSRGKARVRNYLEPWARKYKDTRKSQFIRRMYDYLSLHRCYVPMLRGMRPPLASESSNGHSIDASDCYEERSILDYFDEFPNWHSLDGAEEDKSRKSQQSQPPVFSAKPRIFTGLSLYHDIRKRLLAPTHEERKSIREYETFLSVNFFQDREVTLTPAERNQEGKDNDVVHIKIGESEDRPIYALGDGMQSLIICTYPIITELQRGSLFFLEEPDLCMHPSLQRVFLNVLRKSYIEKGHQFFLTTHSNHLLDLLEDDDLVSIFSFSEIADRALGPADFSHVDSAANTQSPKPGPRFRIRPSDPEDRRTLVQLGVRPSATYLANATIWVEGVSDCAYLRAYMEAFVHYLKIRGNDWGTKLAQRLQQYKEDRHYAFIEYSGANLTHYSFKKEHRENGQAEVSPDIVTSVPHLCARAIVIADGDITTKGDRWKRYAKQLGERFIGLPCKEIENIIPEELMRSQVKSDHSIVDDKVLAKIKYARYRKQTGVGTYLKGLNIPAANYAVKGGTLNSYRKSNWASNLKGIPWLLRQELEREREAERDRDVIVDPANSRISQANDELQSKQDLPNYLTQDLIWLCLCIYIHIAECNHDYESEKRLKGFQQFIKYQGIEPQRPPGDPNGESQPCAESESPAESAAPEWPIKDVNRNCLLASYHLTLTNS
jgi:predicted ATPase